MGQRLHDELKNSPVTVAYVVDKKVNMVTPGLPVVQSMAKLEVHHISIYPSPENIF